MVRQRQIRWFSEHPEFILTCFICYSYFILKTWMVQGMVKEADRKKTLENMSVTRSVQTKRASPQRCGLPQALGGVVLPGFLADGTRDESAWKDKKEPIRWFSEHQELVSTCFMSYCYFNLKTWMILRKITEANRNKTLENRYLHTLFSVHR
jgi:hypothetical protein